MTEKFRKIQCRAALCHDSLPPACQWFGNHEDIRNTIAHIYRIYFFRLPRLTGNAAFLYELFVRFIYTYDGTERIVWALVYFQYILHFCHEFGIRLRNAPFLYKPRLDFVFFITSQTVVSVM